MFSAKYNIYLLFVILSAIYFIYKYHINKYSLLILIFFWQGIFQSFGGLFENVFKIFVVLYSVMLLRPNFNKNKKITDYLVGLSFLAYSIIFWFSYIYYRRGAIFTILSQYFYKLAIPVILFYGLKDIEFDSIKRNYLSKMLLFAIYVQVILSIIKVMIFGFDFEPIVGSMASWGGGYAVVFPLVALLFYWVIKKGNLNKNEWLIIASFIIIAVASGKRTPVFLYPLFLVALQFTRRNTYINIRTLFISIFIAVILFYFAVRLTVTLNPEGKVWGSFDIQYVTDYALTYNFGTDNPKDIANEYYQSEGRGGALTLIFNPQKLGLYSITEILIGNGYSTEGLMSPKHGGWGIEHEGLIGSIIGSLNRMGYLGTLFMVAFCVMIICRTKDIRYRCIFLALYLWDLLLYANLVFFDRPTAFLMIFTIYYVNSYHNNNIIVHR